MTPQDGAGPCDEVWLAVGWFTQIERGAYDLTPEGPSAPMGTEALIQKAASDHVEAGYARGAAVYWQPAQSLEFRRHSQ